MTAEPVLPPGCQCEPADWQRFGVVRSACNRYVPPPKEASAIWKRDECWWCGHCEACHAKPKPTKKESQE